MVFESQAELGGCAIVVDDEGGEAAAAVGVPGPTKVADAVLIEPVHSGIDEAMLTVVFAHFAGDDGYLGIDGRDLAVPAGDSVATVEVVEVE